jgi:hypothetical protein
MLHLEGKMVDLANFGATKMVLAVGDSIEKISFASRKCLILLILMFGMT